MRYAIKVGLAGGESHPSLRRQGTRRELMRSNVSCSGIY
jgi:hypothetical protein